MENSLLVREKNEEKVAKHAEICLKISKKKKIEDLQYN